MLSHMPSAGAPFRVLFVCTGNICRSPLAERVARAFLDAALVEDANTLRLSSAGTRAVVGAGMHRDSAPVLAALGGSGSGFVARQLTDEIAADADLTLALTREHRRAVLQQAPRALARTFTLLEAADLASLVPDGPALLPGAPLPDRWRALVKQMAIARARRPNDGRRDDVPDPLGQSAAFHEEVGQIIADGVVRLFGRFADLAPAPGGRRGPVEESLGLHLSRR
ncbi:hypothetical protein OF117_17375 [Geodermatophilus sp. YIM 151500]|uniref:arsenate reductase/protein-tyrosine-phosphatase family protein n=1 Tax=Geodermatophilus sp. YIM 151500 TaxID=2984531 RepID=UPI0021E4FD80|nr:hypothetical protein [Geodermatophilus sp. YIM 151500]MCV2491123.1 hypothetical protein [Geodermatophilus sp. YIM 151500]